MSKKEGLGPAEALSELEIKALTDKIGFGVIDVFYDLGSGNGRVVRLVAQRTLVKRAIGIERDRQRYLNSNRIRDTLNTAIRAKIQYCCCSFGNYDFFDATVIYNGLFEAKDEVEMYSDYLYGKKAKIVKLDLPLVGYRSALTWKVGSRNFFLMKYPLWRERIKSKDAWASHLLDKPSEIRDVYRYFGNVLRRRGFSNAEIRSAILDLKSLVRERFHK